MAYFLDRSTTHSLARFVAILLAICLLSSVGCGSRTVQTPIGNGNSGGPPNTSLRFEDRTRDAGINFAPPNGEEADEYTMLETLGTGVAMLDFDHDGQLDLWYAGGGDIDQQQNIAGNPSRLYRQREPWKFHAVQTLARIDGPGDPAQQLYSHGAIAADWNNDGFTDMLLTGYGRPRLFQNQGDGTFVECGEAAGLTGASWAASAAWGDVDRDGDLDLYIANYVDWSFERHPACAGIRTDLDICSPTKFHGLPDQLYLNQGDGTFFNGSDSLPELPTTSAPGKGLGVIFADLNWDGWQDLYVANDTTPNFVFLNDKGVLRDESLLSGGSRNAEGSADGSMGIDVADFDGDGRPDIWVTNYENELNALYRNEGDGFFQHVSQLSGIAALGGLSVGWGCGWCDLDNDRDLDLVAANGHLLRHPPNSPISQLPYLLEHRDNRYFNVGGAVGGYFGQAHRGRGLAIGDLDHDGQLDIAVAHQNEPVAVVQNTTPASTEGHWLGLRLIGRESNRDGLGSRITLQIDDETTLTRQRKSGGPYASSHAPTVHIGLGASPRVPRIVIDWPSGAQTTLHDVASNQERTIIEPGQ